MKGVAAFVLFASLSLPSSVLATPSAGPAGEHLEDAARAELPPGWGVVAVHPPSRVRVPADASVTVELAGPVRTGRVSAVLLVHRRDRVVARHVFAVSVAPLRTVLVSRRTLSRGDTVQPGDLELAEHPAADGIELPPEVFAGLRVLRDIEAGVVVTRGALPPPPPVPGGSSVRVLVRVGSVEIATTGVLTRPTRIGDLALVKTERKTLRGRLTGNNLFVVEGDR